MTETDIGLFMSALGGAAWRLNLSKFCERLDAPEDDYWKNKFVEFQEAARMLGRFDNHTLYKLLS